MTEEMYCLVSQDKDNNQEPASGRILEINTAFTTSTTESITTINGENLLNGNTLHEKDWLHINAIIDVPAQKVFLRITDRDDVNTIYFDNELHFMDNANNFRGFFILRGADSSSNIDSNITQRLDNILLKPKE